MVKVDRILAQGPALALRHVRHVPEACQVAPLVPSAKIDLCSDLVGMAGFEPAASCSQIRCTHQRLLGRCHLGVVEVRGCRLAMLSGARYRPRSSSGFACSISTRWAFA